MPEALQYGGQELSPQQLKGSLLRADSANQAQPSPSLNSSRTEACRPCKMRSTVRCWNLPVSCALPRL